MTKNSIERLGVSKLESFFSTFGWLFREQFTQDYGIDAQVEIVVEDTPTGNLIAIQIKSGLSYFSEATSDEIIFRTDNKHVDYWVEHSLPVILVLYNPDEDRFYWESITGDTIVDTGKGWKIKIPKYKILTEDSLSELSNLVQPPPYIQKLNRLRLDKEWIDLVADGEVVYVEFLDWVNKSLSRYGLTIGCNSRDDIGEQIWPTIFGVGLSIDTFLSNTIPWADFEVDEEEYRENMKSAWYDECYIGYDKEVGKPYFTEPFDDWYSPPKGIVPSYHDGEVEGYRLLLTLNNIGKSFLVLDKFLSYEDNFREETFTL